VIGASAIGTSHRQSGGQCEDAHAYRQRADGTLVLAVADGAGSAAWAAAGAACAVAAAVAAADRALDAQPLPATEAAWQDLLAAAPAAARAALEQLAAESPAPAPARPLAAWATTLVLAVVTTRWVAAVQVGDGAVVVQDGLGGLQAALRPARGEYLNETVFLTADDYQARAQYAVLAPVALRGVALLTDGLQMLALNLAAGTPHAPFFTPLFTFATGPGAGDAPLAAFLDSARVCAQTDDDKTLLIAVRQ